MPYEPFHTYVFDKEQVSGPKKPQLHHFKAYGCKAYLLTKSKGDLQYRRKLQKLDPKLHVGFLIGYESTNIYRTWVPHKKKVVSVRDVIFNEEEVWDGKPIQRTPDEIKEMDEAIEVIQLPESEIMETEDIQLGEDPEPLISHQADHEMDDLDVDANDAEKQAEIDDFEWAEGQYPSPDPSILGAFLANSVGLPVENLFVDDADPYESEGVDQSLEDSVAATATLYEEYRTIPEPAVMDQLEKQQNERFYDFKPTPSPHQTSDRFLRWTTEARRSGNSPTSPSTETSQLPPAQRPPLQEAIS